MLDFCFDRYYNKNRKRTNVRLEEVMESRFIIVSLFEIAVAAFIIYGLFFEERFAAAEQRLFAGIKQVVKHYFSAGSSNLRTDP